MRLSKFTIKNYKIIDDTGPVKVDPLVTALVGKNESGKSAVMRAMWKSKNVVAAQFDKLLDYPRDRYSRERRETQEVTRLEFELTEAERAALMQQLPADAAPGPTHVRLVTYYEGEDKSRATIECDWDMPEMPTGSEALAAIEVLKQATYAAGGGEALSAVGTGDQFSREAPLWDESVAKVLAAVHSAATQWIGADEVKKKAVSAQLAAVTTMIERAKKGDSRAIAQAWAAANLPSFIYFDEYGTLRTLIHLPSYLGRRNNPDAETRTQTALFEWSHLDPVEIMDLGRPRQGNETDEQVHRRHEKRRALLDSASFSLTGDWMQWWQGEDHRLVFDADGEFLVLKVSDTKNPFPIPFGERSRGFQWFFSFYLVFLVESGKAHKGAILLLDEPGLHLHPTLQMRLLSFFERVSKDNQLIYSTHLPFLVDGNNLQRVRTVHLSKSLPAKTVISTDVRPTGDKDTLFPLQAALGYSIAQTLFIGKRTVIVEGIIDYWIIKSLDVCIAAAGKGGNLHEETVLVPAGGTSKLMPLASVMLASTEGIKGRLLVLLDSDGEGRQAAKRLEEAFGAEAPVLMLGAGISREDATIEDLVPRDIYLDALKRSGHPVEPNAAESAETMTVKAIESAYQRLGKGKFGIPEKTAAALVLMDDWRKDPGKIPASTLAAGRQLIAAINSRF